MQGKFAEAEPLLEYVQSKREEVLGLEHPEVGTTLNNRAKLLESQVRAVWLQLVVVCGFLFLNNRCVVTKNSVQDDRDFPGLFCVVFMERGRPPQPGGGCSGLLSSIMLSLLGACSHGVLFACPIHTCRGRPFSVFEQFQVERMTTLIIPNASTTGAGCWSVVTKLDL